jgi:hypothetical protein
MEIRTIFGIIIGIIMMITVTIATVAMMGGLIDMSVSECNPTQYTATETIYRTSEYKACGLDTNKQQLYCNNKDDCMDASNNLCCPTSQSGTGWHVTDKNTGGKCCNITKI